MTPRQISLGADIAAAAIIASVGIAAAGLSWRVYSLFEAPLPPEVRVRPPTQVGVDLTPIVALAPFGSGAPAAASPTNLPLVLRGIILAHPASASSAIIASGAEPSKAYAIGQSVGGGTIESIQADRIVLNVGGRREYLAFPRSGEPIPTATPPPSIAAPAPPAPPSGAAMVERMGANATDNGYKIGASPPPLLRSAGIRPGDVIEQVNGSPLGDPERDRQLLSPANLAAGASVTILRDGKRITLSFPPR